MNRYERITIKNLIDGYMVGSKDRPMESKSDQFQRAKAELIENLNRQIRLAEEFQFEDFGRK